MLEEQLGRLDEARCSSIRSSMQKIFVERALKLNITQQQAPGITIDDMIKIGAALQQRGLHYLTSYLGDV